MWGRGHRVQQFLLLRGVFRRREQALIERRFEQPELLEGCGVHRRSETVARGALRRGRRDGGGRRSDRRKSPETGKELRTSNHRCIYKKLFHARGIERYCTRDHIILSWAFPDRFQAGWNTSLAARHSDTAADACTRLTVDARRALTSAPRQERHGPPPSWRYQETAESWCQL